MNDLGRLPSVLGDETRLRVSHSRFANGGLVYQKFLLNFDRREENLEWVRQAVARTGELYRLAFARARALRETRAEADVRVQGRLTLGLGSVSVHQIGFTFHPVYGVPYIPGSSLKGLAAHYAHRVWGEDRGDGRYRYGGDVHRWLFGRPPGQQAAPAEQGLVVFHDAWIWPDDLDTLRLDVMTPHHTNYYTGKRAPDGMEDPVPVPFLCVQSARFWVRVSCPLPGPQAEVWTRHGLQILLEALANWGIGAKTSSGYGRALVEGISQAEPSQFGVFASPSGSVPEWPAVTEGTDAGTDPTGFSPGSGFAASSGRDATAIAPVGKHAGPDSRVLRSAGTRLLVRRIEDPKGKGRLWFAAVEDESIQGGVTGQVPWDQPPGMGDTLELELANDAKPFVNWRWPKPKDEAGGRSGRPPAGSPQRSQRGGPPAPRRR